MVELPFHNKICPFELTLLHGKKLPCERPQYEDHGFCIFHSGFLEEKRVGFIQALGSLIDEIRKNDLIAYYDFRGFVFPRFKAKTMFALEAFDKPVSFQFAEFKGTANFFDCKFLYGADFSYSRFDANAIFNKCKFSAVKFIACSFDRMVSFQFATFNSRATFSACGFSGKVNFSKAIFFAEAIFAGTRYQKDALFISANFLDSANFMNTDFRGRSEFRGAIFSNEVAFTGAHLAFIKNPPAVGVNLDGAVLKSAHIWNNPSLERYSFVNAFLLSLNFSDKEVVDCDFTGAVIKAVLTQGWRPDAKTIANTKYIYTDYEVGNIGEEGATHNTYKRVEESRVPAEGVFGEGEHEHFTIADYLKEPLKWSFALNVPPMFRTAVLNYLQFFTDFMSVTESVSVEIRTRQEGGKIRVEFMTGTQAEKELVRERFNQYRDNTTKDLASLDIRFNNSEASEVEKELFRIRYEHTINSLRTELNYTKRLLQKEEEKNQLQVKYLDLLVQADAFTRDPQKLLLPALDTSTQRSSTPIFFLTADLKDYSKATRENNALYALIQTFLFDQKERIRKDPVCDAVKLEGDAIKVFFRDGVKLIWIARGLINDFENLKYEQPSSIRGFRVVLGYGTAHREQRREEVDYSGDPIVETCRVDQPMKRYIEERDEDPNQIWCTETFYDQISGQHPNVSFDELPPTDLDKGYGLGARLFRVRVE